jgi:hypothetical protein
MDPTQPFGLWRAGQRLWDREGTREREESRDTGRLILFNTIIDSGNSAPKSRRDREAERQGEREEKGGDRERRQRAGNIRANTRY